MSERQPDTVDGNHAVASVAYRLSEVIAIYPITPASPMGELADEWSVQGRVNILGDVPTVSEMQAEGGAAGAVHGALQAGALSTTFTASQGLLLMLPNMYKIAGELTPCVIHVAARSLATHALSIFCDHSDVMACRGTGFALLSSASVQEAHDLAAIAHAVTLECRIPFVHFCDGFRTSHELTGCTLLTDEELVELVGTEAIAQHRERALSPEHPVVRGTAQNPDTFFQAREAINPFYERCPGVVERVMDRFAAITGRRYLPFEYSGHPEAERVIIQMGSGAITSAETARDLASAGERVGVIQVRLYRPFSAECLLRTLPRSVRAIAVLDRTKEPGALGEPLFLDVVAALRRGQDTSNIAVVGGRYGLSSKEYTPRMAKAVFDELSKADPKPEFTLGIRDDVSDLDLDLDLEYRLELDSTYEAVFFGLGSDGTVGANKNTIKILGKEGAQHVQAYFVYDSKKAGAVTVSHLRFGEQPVRAPYLIEAADFVGCHQFEFLDRIDVVSRLKPGGVLLLNCPHDAEKVVAQLSTAVQRQLIEKRAELYVVDGYEVAREAGLGRRINTVMQACFFAISQVLAQERAVVCMKDSIEKTYGRRSREMVRRNHQAVDKALDHLHPVPLPEAPFGRREPPPAVPGEAPEFVQRVTAAIIAGRGDLLPVSAFPVDGTWPSATSQWEKRNIATEIPEWDDSICIQCNKCVLMCPHAAIRAKVCTGAALKDKPPGFKVATYRGPGFAGERYTLQVAPEDCTGCRLCVEVCPVKDKGNPRRKALNMVSQRSRRDEQRNLYAYFLSLPEPNPASVRLDVKGSQLLRPLMEYSGACAGCGETPYVKLMTQLFGDRALVANATGCSSIFGGNLPTTPFAKNDRGQGPAWANSLFEDNAEFGFGFKLALNAQEQSARRLLGELSGRLGGLAEAILGATQTDNSEIREQRERVRSLNEQLAGMPGENVRRLQTVVDCLVKKSVWIVGGDGWAYDIGYGGLDHVLASQLDVNILVLDTEVYSNTGGQQSKATPMAAAAKYATAGKATPKKDLGLLAMTYGHVYVARVAIGAKDAQTVKAFVEADAHPGPSLIIAYSHCIAHGYDLAHGATQQRLAVDSGMWPLYRFDPKRGSAGEPPLTLDHRPPRIPVGEYMRNEARFRMVESVSPRRFKRLAQAAQEDAGRRTELYEYLSHLSIRPQHDAPPASSVENESSR